MDTVYLDITADVRDDEWVESAENEPTEEELWWAQTSKILGLSPEDVYADDEDEEERWATT